MFREIFGFLPKGPSFNDPADTLENLWSINLSKTYADRILDKPVIKENGLASVQIFPSYPVSVRTFSSSKSGKVARLGGIQSEMKGAREIAHRSLCTMWRRETVIQLREGD